MMELLYNFHSENVVTKSPKVHDVPLSLQLKILSLCLQ